MQRELDDGFDERRLEFGALLHPSQVFDLPADVVREPALTLDEKRGILASWASDSCAIEATPALRKSPSGRVVCFDEIMDALRSLDQQRHAEAERRCPPPLNPPRTRSSRYSAGEGAALR